MSENRTTEIRKNRGPGVFLDATVPIVFEQIHCFKHYVAILANPPPQSPTPSLRAIKGRGDLCFQTFWPPPPYRGMRCSMGRGAACGVAWRGGASVAMRFLFCIMVGGKTRIET